MDELSVSFGIESEINVREAFSLHADKLGYTIKNSRDQFPDYELVDDSGNTVLAEAETMSRDFMSHGHDVESCDLILCWYDNLPLSPLPTLELGKCISAPSTPPKPNEFVSIHDPGAHIKTIEMWETPQDTRNFRFGWYLRENGIITHKSPGTPNLNQSEFSELFRQINPDIREKAFVDVDFDSLIEWHKSIPEQEKIRPDRKGRILASLDKADEGEKVLKLRDESHINISRYLDSGRQHPDSQNSATIDKNAYLGLLSHIPREIREQTFLDLNLESLWDWHQY